MSNLRRPGPVDLETGIDPAGVRWDRNGLVVGVVQDVADGRVLMVGWLDVEALAATLGTGDVHFHSRSRGRLWRKGETSGHTQVVRELRLDCDGDTVLLTVEQQGGIACHTGRERCFFQRLTDGQWVSDEPVLRSPDAIYPGASGHE